MWVLKTHQNLHQQYRKLPWKHHSTVQIPTSKLQVTGFWWEASRSLKSCKATSQAPPDQTAVLQGKIALWPWTFCLWQETRFSRQKSIWSYESIWIKGFCDVEKGLRIVLLKTSTGALQTSARKHVVPTDQQTKIPRTFLASSDNRTVRDKVSFQLPAMQVAKNAQSLMANHGLQGLLDLGGCTDHSEPALPVLTATIKYHCDCYQ